MSSHYCQNRLWCQHFSDLLLTITRKHFGQSLLKPLLLSALRLAGHCSLHNDWVIFQSQFLLGRTNEESYDPGLSTSPSYLNTPPVQTKSGFSTVEVTLWKDPLPLWRAFLLSGLSASPSYHNTPPVQTKSGFSMVEVTLWKDPLTLWRYFLYWWRMT